MPSKLKILTALTISALSLSIASAAEAGIESVQREAKFNLDIPFSQSSLMGSHNSYNTKNWGYAFPNQNASITDQLKWGANFVELDLGFKTLEQDEVYLCHSKAEKVGVCGDGDSYLGRGLDEIVSFLKDDRYKDRVIVIYLEDQLKHPDRNYGRALHRVQALLNDKLGNYIYKSTRCRTVPANLTPQDVIDAGNRVIIFKDGDCSEGTNATLSSIVFTDLGAKREWEALSFFDKKVDFKRPEIVKKFETGTRFVNLDFLSNTDHVGTSWNWGNQQQPTFSGCAFQTQTRGIGNGLIWKPIGCDLTAKFACQNRKTLEWKIPGKSGKWGEGDTICSGISDDYFFSVPHNAQSNLKLSELGGNVWLNYKGEGVNWEPLAHAYNQPPRKIAINAPDTDWEQLPGCATDIDVAPSGTAWTIGCDRQIYKIEGNTRTRVQGYGERIAVDNAGIPWHVNTGVGSIWRGNDKNASGWTKVSGCARDIGIGPSGRPWVIGCSKEGNDNFSIHKWTGSKWQKVSGGAVQISVDDQGIPWIVNKQGYTYRAKNVDGTGGWERLSTSFCATGIGAGPSGKVWVLECTPGENGYQVREWTGNAWRQISEFGNVVGIGPNQSRWIIRGGLTYRRLN